MVTEMRCSDSFGDNNSLHSRQKNFSSPILLLLIFLCYSPLSCRLSPPPVISILNYFALPTLSLLLFPPRLFPSPFLVPWFRVSTWRLWRRSLRLTIPRLNSLLDSTFWDQFFRNSSASTTCRYAFSRLCTPKSAKCICVTQFIVLFYDVYMLLLGVV